MQYAVVHNHDVHLRTLALDDYKSNKVRAAGAFLPYVGGSINGQFNFGRAIDPETNTYTNVSTYYNGYNLSASLPLFEGLHRYHDMRAAQAAVGMGRQGLQAQKDNVAQAVFKAFIDVLYYQGAVRLTREKLAESRLLLQQTCVMAEVGTKSEADIAQMNASCSTDDYELTHQQGLLTHSLLALKQLMNYPVDEELILDTLVHRQEETAPVTAADIYARAYRFLPSVKEAEYNLQMATYRYKSYKGGFWPSLSLGAGISTSYYKTLGDDHAVPFNEQFRNHAGKYIYATLSVPLFERLNLLTGLRQQRNNLIRARENLDRQHTTLRCLIEETLTNRENSRKAVEKMRRKVEADHLASRLTIRRYEEGLASAIDVQTAAFTLLQSKALLLQEHLIYIYTTRILKYYQGEPLWTER